MILLFLIFKRKGRHKYIVQYIEELNGIELSSPLEMIRYLRSQWGQARLAISVYSQSIYNVLLVKDFTDRDFFVKILASNISKALVGFFLCKSIKY